MEVDNILATGFITEVKYLEWLANVVVVPKNGGKWNVYVDYTDLNEACPKDIFPLPRINQIMDATVEHGIFFFFWTPSPDITKFLCTRLTQRKQPSSYPKGCTATT